MNEKAKMWRIYFETGDDLLTLDPNIAKIHREKDRMVVEIEVPAMTADEEKDRS